MPNLAFPSLGSIEPSWADIAVTATVIGGDLLTMADIKAIKWSRKVEVGLKRGASGGRVMARTMGEGSQEASMELYRGGLRTLIKSLMKGAQAANLVRGNQLIIGAVAFDIMIQFTPVGETEIYQVKIKGCRYLGDSDDSKEGADPSTIEVTLNPIEIVQIINGQEVVLV
jgi:hypothetical protein